VAIAADAYNLQQLGNCYLELGRHEDALAKLRQALELNPGLADLRRDLGCRTDPASRGRTGPGGARRLEAGRSLESFGLDEFIGRQDVAEALTELKTFVDLARSMPDKVTRDKVRLLRGTASRALPTDRLEKGHKRARTMGFSFVGFGQGRSASHAQGRPRARSTRR